MCKKEVGLGDKLVRGKGWRSARHRTNRQPGQTDSVLTHQTPQKGGMGSRLDSALLHTFGPLSLLKGFPIEIVTRQT